ncbi:MAG: radical SAM protein [Candidatus Adiutrix sp.]|jgi:hypothetical protein|nr:radical SAM protein [Candidatus Adiutrix sp.]
MTSQPLIRSRLAAAEDPNLKLAALMGPEFSRYRAAWAEAEGGRRPAAPLHLDVDVTTACNFTCPMCPAGHSGHIFPGFTRGRFLPRALYQKALAEARDFALPSLRLGLTGEPLLIPEIDQWVGEARAAGVLDVSLITNGRLLSPPVSRRLIEAGLTRLMISVDAGEPETYARVRPGGDWAALLENIDSFLAIRREIGSITPLLRVSFVEMTANLTDRANFEAIFAPRADYLSFQRYQNILGGSDTDFSPGPAPARPGFCTEPFTRLALQVDGGLFPCCSDFGRWRPLGNLQDTSLLAVWRSAGPDFKAEPCQACRQRAGFQILR